MNQPARRIEVVEDGQQAQPAQQPMARARFIAEAEPDPSPGRTAHFFLSGLNKQLLSAPDAAALSILKGMGLAPDDARTTELGRALSLDMVPLNTAERVAEEAGRGFMINLAGIIPQFRAAQLSQSAPAILNPTVATRVRQSLLDYMSSNPKAAFAMEQISASLGAGAMKLAEEKGSGPMGQTAAGVAGGVAPAVVGQYATRSLYGAATRAIYRVVNKQQFEDMARRDIGKAFLDGMDERGEQNLRQAVETFSELGMDMPLTAAEATRSPNLLKLQQNAEIGATGSTLNFLSRRKLDVQDQVLAAHRPEMTGIEPDIVYDAGTRRLVAARRRMDQAQQDLDRRRPAPLEEANRPELGAALRQRADDLRAEVRGQFAQRAEAIGLNNRGVEFPLDGLQAALREEFIVRQSRFAEGGINPTIRRMMAGAQRQADDAAPQILDAAGRPMREADGAALSFEDMQYLRRELNDQASRAAAQGDYPMLRQLTRAKRIFDTYFDSVDPINGNPELISQWRQFRADYKTQVIDRFDKGAAYRIRRPGKRDEYVLADEKVADAFLGSNRGVRDFMRLYGDDPEALMALRSAAIDKARLAGGVLNRDGEINGRGLAAWIRKNPWLDDLPAVKRELENTASAHRAFSEREASLNARAAVINRSRLAAALDGNPDDMVERALRDPFTARSLVRTARMTETHDALRSAIWGKMERDLDVKPGELADPDRLRRWMEKNNRSLKVMLDAEHIRHINSVYKGLESITQLPLPAGQAQATGPLDKLEAVTGTGVPQISSRVFAAESGRVAYRYMFVDGMSRFLNRLTKNRQEALLQEALFNPELARDMATLVRMPDVPKPIERRMNNWLYTLGMLQASEQEWLRAPGLEE